MTVVFQNSKSNVVELLAATNMSVTTPLLETIEPDEPPRPPPKDTNQSTARTPVILTPTSHGPGAMATNADNAESGTYLYQFTAVEETDLNCFQASLEYFGRCDLECGLALPQLTHAVHR